MYGSFVFTLIIKKIVILKNGEVECYDKFDVLTLENSKKHTCDAFKENKFFRLKRIMIYSS